VYTQNIDGLEAKAGLSVGIDPLSSVVPLHGSLITCCCNKCGELSEFKEIILEEALQGRVPDCPKCSGKQPAVGTRRSARLKTIVGKLIPNVLLYGQVHPQGF
jgi:NAD-dependent SIR2 family protein deacetylase